MTRRPPGDGSLYYDPRRDRWVGMVDLGRGPDGKRQRRKISARTRGEATEKLRLLVAELRRSGTVGRQDVTVEHVVRDFLAAPPPEWRSPSTFDTAEDHANRIIKGLGRTKVVKLSARDVERFLFHLAALGLSASTLRHTRILLAQALRRAQRDGLVSQNVAEVAVMPRAPKRPSKALTRPQVASLLALDLDAWWRAFITTGLSAGLRPGELLGLRWEDVDFTDSVLRVRKSLKEKQDPAGGWRPVLDDLKTEASRRTLAMPGGLGVVLRAHRTAQAAQRLSATQYQDHGLVFAGDDGRPRWRAGVRVQFGRLCAQAGIPGRWTLHELRHSFVSLLSDGGVPIEAIADAAGHSSTSTTLGVYRHVIADRVNVAGARVMDDILSKEART